MSEKAKAVKSVGDYTVLPLTLPPLPSFPTKATHYLYIRPHAPKNFTPSQAQLHQRQIFLANIPIDAGTSSIKTLFKNILGEAGRVADVEFEGQKARTKQGELEEEEGVVKSEKRKRAIADLEAALDRDAKLPSTWDVEIKRSGSTAVVLFVDKKSAEAAMKTVKSLVKKGDEVVWKGEAMGEKRYKIHHARTYPDTAVITAHINSYLTTHTTLQKVRDSSMRKLSAPDEDGFVTVTRQGSRTTPATIAGAEAAKSREEEKKKRAAEESTNFYRFQGREKRKEREMELKRKFEEDRKKVESMRQKRLRTS